MPRVLHTDTFAGPGQTEDTGQSQDIRTSQKQMHFAFAFFCWKWPLADHSIPGSRCAWGIIQAWRPTVRSQRLLPPA